MPTRTPEPSSSPPWSRVEKSVFESHRWLLVLECGHFVRVSAGEPPPRGVVCWQCIRGLVCTP